MQARAAQAPIYNARCVRTSHLVSGDKTARRVLSLVILTSISSTNTPLMLASESQDIAVSSLLGGGGGGGLPSCQICIKVPCFMNEVVQLREA